MKFYVDENINSSIVLGLEQRGFDLAYVAEENPGVFDKEHLLNARRQERVIVTADEDFLRLDKNLDHNGIFFLTDQEEDVGATIRKIAEISSKISREQFRNHIKFI
jgi:predicted nuclease of predicted toxin-antitoxin system